MSFIPAIGSLPVPAPKPAAPQVEIKDKSSDVFAALLDSKPAEPAAPAAKSNDAPKSDDAATKPADDTTAAVDATAPADKDDEEVEGKDLLDNLLDLMGQLDTALQNNQPIDPALLDQLNSAIAALAGFLGIDLTDLDPAMAAGGGKPIDPTSLLGQLTQKAGDLSKLLAGADADIAGKLEALAQKLQSSGISAETLAKLGFALEAQPMPEPELAAPELKLPENSLTKTAEQVAAPKAPEVALEKKPAEASAPVAAAKPAEKAPEAAVHADKKGDDKNKAAAPAAPQSADPTAPVSGTAARMELLGGVRAVQVAYQAPPTQVNIPQLAFDIVRQVQAGNTKFHIRLDPPEMGRIDVRMDVDNKGNVTTRLTVEKSETLDLLQRDQRSLEKALAQAGIEGGKSNLEFSLRQNSSGQRDGQGDAPRTPFGSGPTEAANDDGAQTAALTQYRGTASASGLNLFV